MAQLGVTAVLVEGRSKSEVAREYGVSRRWVITLMQRFLAEGQTGLEPRSRRPRLSPHRTARSVEEEIVALRKDLLAAALALIFFLRQKHDQQGLSSGSTGSRATTTAGHRG